MGERELFLGEAVDPSAHARTGQRLSLDLDDLTTHGVIVGMTGSGKTGLAIDLLEEALLHGVPALLLDPKGDLTNLALTFPELRPDQFAPWVPPGSDPAQVATTWTEGLASWGLDGSRIAELRARAEVRVYSPGSSAAAPLNVLGSLAVPTATDAETLRDEAEATVSALLGLLGIDADPLTSREHILLANLVLGAWSNGRPLDLGQLIAQVQDPPLRKLGVIDLDSFFPRSDRAQLALRLNGLLASPTFAAWLEGEPLDIDRLLGIGADRPAASVVYLAHLSDAERQFVVTLVLSKLISWMRARSGSPRLQVLVYMDEVIGFVPPTANPPAKKPILTVLKQARAYGVGMVLATQNPVDLDYKAISNAGTWLIGRLQTERDQDRLLEGMTSAAGQVDVRALGDTLAGLGKREFVLHQAGGRAPAVFTSRWAMSYLAGPLTREQLRLLPRPEGTTSVAGPPAAAPPADRGSATVGPDAGAPTGGSVGSAPGVPAGVVPTPLASAERALAADETTLQPAVAEGVPVRFADPAAPWLGQVGGSPSGQRWSAGVALLARLRFDDARLGLTHTEEWEAVLHPLGEAGELDGLVAVDHDDRDFRADAPAGACFVLPAAAIDRPTFWSRTRAALQARIRADSHLALFRNRELGLVSRPGESEADFRARCHAAAEQREDAEADELRAKVARQAFRLQDRIDDARARLDELEANQASRTRHEMVSAAGDVLGSLLGGRSSARSLARAIRGASGRRTQTAAAASRVERAQHTLQDRTDDLAQLEEQLSAQLVELDDRWAAKAEAVEPVDVGLSKADVELTEVRLVWLPVQ